MPSVIQFLAMVVCIPIFGLLWVGVGLGMLIMMISFIAFHVPVFIIGKNELMNYIVPDDDGFKLTLRDVKKVLERMVK